MVISKTTFTAEEQAEITRLENIIMDNTPPWHTPKTSEELEAAAVAYSEAMEKHQGIIAAANDRYIAEAAQDYARIMADTAAVLEAFTAEDYIRVVSSMREAIERHITSETGRADRLREAGNVEEQERAKRVIESETRWLKDYCGFTYHSARNRLLSLTANQLKAIKKGKHPRKEYDALVKAKAAELYPKATTAAKPSRSIDLAQYNAAASYEQLSLFGAPFIPMMHGIPTDGLMGLSFKGAEPDPLRDGAATIRVRDKGSARGEYIVTISHYDALQSRLSTSAWKLLDTAAAILTQRNSYKAGPEDINPSVDIDLMEYARANGYKVDRQPVKTEAEAEQQERRIEENLKKLKQDIRRDLTDMKKISQTWEEVKGANRGDYRDVSLISSHSVMRGKIRINLDIEFARYIVSGYCMQYPPALLLHDNRNPSSYVIGRKLALHNSMLSNQEKGTANTLGVKSLLEAAPAIPSIEELRERGRRDWKTQIKAKLEKALDDNIAVGYLTKWRYHDGATGRELTKEQAAALSWDAYYSLYVDFTTAEQPDLAKSLEAHREERSKAAALEGKKEPKRRGRPRKSAK